MTITTIGPLLLHLHSVGLERLVMDRYRKVIVLSNEPSLNITHVVIVMVDVCRLFVSNLFNM
jgi:hypothetical protein